jgi:hypothetical protein
MRRKLVKVEIVEGGEHRFLLQVFSDGTENRRTIIDEEPADDH